VKLIGRYMSPFVRRVGISLHLLDIPFTNEPLSVLTDSLKIREYSPLGRLPALVLDDGQVLIDSNAILDYFDQQAGGERALLPLSGPLRSEAMNLLAFAVGACEKTVAAYYERDRRPEGLVWDDWYRHCEDQARGALALLDARQAERGERPLLGERMSQVDISAVVATTSPASPCPARWRRTAHSPTWQQRRSAPTPCPPSLRHSGRAER